MPARAAAVFVAVVILDRDADMHLLDDQLRIIARRRVAQFGHHRDQIGIIAQQISLIR